MKAGFTAPSVTGQVAVIQDAWADAGVDPASVEMIEAHGTGTVVGDSIELRALTRAFQGASSCALGSVKSNIGHLDAAAGMAGLFKSILALENELIPPTLHFHQGNPDVDWEQNPFHVPTTTQPWPRTATPRRAGISAFGFGGTNAHIVLEEAPLPTPSAPSPRDGELLVLSARSPEALDRATDRLATFIRNTRPNPADMAYTLATGRQEFPYRRAVWGHDLDELAHALETRSPHTSITAHAATHTPDLVFLFPGQGSHHPGAANDLYHAEPVFRDAINTCAEHLLAAGSIDIRDALFGDTPELLTQTRWAQPALFSLEWALTRLWASWGITPTAMIGHSLGEWVAACVAGVFTLPDALRLLLLRGELMQSCPPGQMLAISTTLEQLTPHLTPDIDIAALNTSRDIVVSGTAAALHNLATTLSEHRIPTHTINEHHAFHSRHMDGILTDFTHAVAATPLHPPTIPFASNVTGKPITNDQATTPSYWAQHIRSTVHFADNLTTLTTPHTTLLELGPHQTLTTLARRHTTHTAIPTLPHPRDNHPSTTTTRTALAHLWTTGHPIPWTHHYTDNRHHIPLPTYPFTPTPHRLTTPTTPTRWTHTRK
ncbi:type I polyketide synthase, partial [Microbacterium enclense]|uniref:type I polyketide synthase n=1 Tax=Microbacterium enclense TaxID=993073 RepID=UPI003F7EE5CC